MSRYAIGIGCRRGCPAEAIVRLVRDVCGSTLFELDANADRAPDGGPALFFAPLAASRPGGRRWPEGPDEGYGAGADPSSACRHLLPTSGDRSHIAARSPSFRVGEAEPGTGELRPPPPRLPGSGSPLRSARNDGEAGLALSSRWVSEAASPGLFTADLKCDEAGLREAATALSLPLTFLSAAALEAAMDRVLTRSARVADATGLPSIAEAAALAGAGPGARLLGPRQARDGVTCAIALREERP